MICLLALVFLSFMATQWKDRQRIDGIEVIGATGLSRLSVQRAVDSVRFRRARTITLANVRQAVERIPYVRNASVYFSGVNDLCVDVTERLPVAHVVRSGGVLRYIDDLGTVLPIVQERTAHNVPMLHGKGGIVLGENEIRDLAALLASACRVLDSRLYQSISELTYDRVAGSVDVVTDDAVWHLGRIKSNRAMEALADMNVFWKDASASLRLAGVHEVDLRWRNQIVLRYRNERAQTTSGGAAV
ncbi:MAG: FtsQ-type POTRA domain-containing protein [Candidatus Kapabacteria bacterium]|nr:FtsQ-type POTRA domain-containing protein [Candidatus Kapabacteria bacterium]